MITYPISFFGSSQSSSGISTSWNTASSGFDLSCSVPKEFEGSGEHLSPEDLFLMALQNCFVATFKVFAAYSKLEYKELKVQSELVVDKDEGGRPVMKSILLDICIEGPSDSRKADILAKKTLDNGFILRSVKTQIVPKISII